MTQIMTPSTETTTAGQINKAVANYRAMLEKHAPLFSADTVQHVLGQTELAGEQFAVFRRRVEDVGNLFVRKVKVNRNRTQQEALEAIGYVQYIDRKVVDNMPKGEGDEVEVVFFKPDLSNRDGFIFNDELEKEFELRGLKPADPVSVAAVNEADSAFADEKLHGTHWKDAKGNWCCATFDRWDGECEVYVDCNDNAWYDGWWFAGVRK